MKPPKPLPFVLPRSKPRPSQQRSCPHRMTILAAFSTSAGTILCADTQETVGYAKKSVSKIIVDAQRDNPQFRFAIAAGGHGAYADKLTEELGSTIKQYKEYDPESIIKGIEATLTEFHSKHLWPRANVQDAPQVETLILFQPIPGEQGKFAGHPLLLHTAETAVNITHDYKTVGIGSWLADYILDRLYPHHGNRHYMFALASYVIKEVRENVEGCGKEADIMFFGKDGSWEELSGEKYEFLESQVPYVSEAMSDAFFRMTQIPTGVPHEGESRLENVIETVEGVRSRYAGVIQREEEERRLRRIDMEQRRKATGTDDIPF
jgi:20S proteasome alpha/beta subunit